MRTPKIKKFNDLIDILNEKKGLTINKYSYPTQDFCQDGWLAGFTDADGSFGIIYIKELSLSGKTTKKRTRACRLRIQQRMIDPLTNESYEDLFNKIALVLGVNLKVVTRNTGKQYFSLQAKNRSSLSIVLNYLNTYPWFSFKYLDFLDWEKVANLILHQTHYDEENSDLIEELKGGINNNRSKFNWSHLDRLGKKKVLLGLKKNFSSNNNSWAYLYRRSNFAAGHKFKSYLAGLFEGDGHIWIQKSGSKRHNPRFCITFHMKNEPLAKKLLELVGSGFIRYKLQDKACVLVVSPVVGLKKIVNLINGELRTPKIHQLYALIDWLNKNHSTNITKLSIKNSPLYQDSWLSGFTDSDGSFSIVYTKLENGAKKRKIACRLRIEQRISDPITKESNEPVLTNIANFLNCSLLTRNQKSTGNNYYTLAASSQKSLNIIVDYFVKYPLFSSKYLDYKDWKKIVELILENKHYTKQGISLTNSVKNGMNRQRTYFNWDHLNNFEA